MIRREHDRQQISSWKKEKPCACSNHAFRTTDFKLHINLDWTPQKLAENSLGLHRSSREKTLSSYEHRQKNGVKREKCGEKVKKKKRFFFFLFKPATLATGPRSKPSHCILGCPFFCRSGVSAKTVTKEGLVKGPIFLSFRNSCPPVFGQILSTCQLVMYAPNHNS